MTQMRRYKWFGAVALVCLALALTGCGSLLSFKSTKPPPGPAPATPSIRQMELEAAVARWAEDALGLLAVTGAPAQAPVILEARAGVRAVRTRIGEPGEALPLPTSPMIVDKAVMTARESLEAENAALRRRALKVAADYEEWRTTPVKTGWSIGSGWMRSSIIVAVLALVLFLVVKVVWGTLVTRTALVQTVKGVKKFIIGNPAEAPVLKQTLASVQSPQTQRKIDVIKRQ